MDCGDDRARCRFDELTLRGPTVYLMISTYLAPLDKVPVSVRRGESVRVEVVWELADAG